MRILEVSVVVFILNLPFGYWRSNVRKFSFQWVLSIHIPVPFIILFRIYSSIGFAWFTYLFLVSAFSLGQKSGSIMHNWYLRKYHHVTSCLVMDVKRLII